MGPAGCTMNLRRTHVLHKTPMLPPGKCLHGLGPIPGSLAGRVIMLQHQLWLKALRVTLLPRGSVVVLRELTIQTKPRYSQAHSSLGVPPDHPHQCPETGTAVAGHRWRHNLIPNQFWLLYVRFRMLYRKVSIFH